MYYVLIVIAITIVNMIVIVIVTLLIIIIIVIAIITIVLAIAGYNAFNLSTNIVDFRGFDSSIISILMGGIPRSIGDFTESVSQAMLVGCNVSRETGRATCA